MSAGDTFLGVLGGMAAADAMAKKPSPQAPANPTDGMDPTFVAVLQIRKEVSAINQKLGIVTEDYVSLMTQYNALVERFKQGRADLLGTYRSKLAYRQVAHDLSGASYEEVDKAAQEARPNFDKEVEAAGERQYEKDKKAGIT